MDGWTRREAMSAAAMIAASPALLAADRPKPDRLFINGRILTHDPRRPEVTALACEGELIVATGSDAEILHHRGPGAEVIDLGGRRVIPGLNDSHMHFVRGGLSYNLDVRWDGVPTLKAALQRLRDQVARTPPGQWVRVGGGWSQYQFAERRPPTIEELNAVAPNTPVYVLYFYDKAFINRAGLRALGMSAASKPLPGGEILRDGKGEPTGVLIAHPFPATITAPESKMPALSPADARNSVQQFMLELNRLGLTSVIDPGGVGQPYPGMYQTISGLARDHALTLRLGMYLLPQDSGGEVKDFQTFMQTVKVGGPDHWFRFVGGGEILVQKAMDWDLYTTPPVTVSPTEIGPLEKSIEVLADNGWYIREHATFDSTISLYLDALDRASRVSPLNRVRWAIDHAELISEASLQRVKRMGGGIAIQHRAAFHGEVGVANFGRTRLRAAPPVKRMLELGIPVGAGTDATRDTTYNPWVCLQWLVTGKTVGGDQLIPKDQCLDLPTALKVYSNGSAWFSGEEALKGILAPGKFADFAVLSDDVLRAAPERLHHTQSLLTVAGGRPVFAQGALSHLAPPAPAVSPSWSPEAGKYRGYDEG